MLRTEHKIGIVVGLVVLVGSVVFFMRQGGQSSGNVADVLPMNAPVESVAKDKSDRLAADTAARRLGESSARPSADRTTRRDTVKPPVQTPTEKPTLVADAKPASPRPGSGHEVSTTDDKPAPPTWTMQPRTTTQPAVISPRPAVVEREEPVAASPPGAATGAASPSAQRPSLESAVLSPPPQAAPSTALPRPGQSTATPSALGASQSPAGTDSSGTRAALPSPAAARGATRHTIAEEDNLWNLAVRYYDDGSLWSLIKEANPDLNPDRLLVGQSIVIPPRTGVTAAPAPTPTESTARPAARRHTYIVERGDTLVKIARNVLRDGRRWRELWELNRDVVPNADHLPVGTELKLPDDSNQGPEHG